MHSHLTRPTLVPQQLLAPHGVCILSNPDAHSRFGMDVFPRQLEEEGLRIELSLPLPLKPPACGEDETLSDVVQHHIMVITVIDDGAWLERRT